MQPQPAARYNVTIVLVETYYFPRHASHCRDGKELPSAPAMVERLPAGQMLLPVVVVCSWNEQLPLPDPRGRQT